MFLTVLCHFPFGLIFHVKSRSTTPRFSVFCLSWPEKPVFFVFWKEKPWISKQTVWSLLHRCTYYIIGFTLYLHSIILVLISMLILVMVIVKLWGFLGAFVTLLVYFGFENSKLRGENNIKVLGKNINLKSFQKIYLIHL